MPRAIEDYICASEDRPHYNNETLDLYGFYYPMRRPHVTTINIINKTEIIEQGVSEEQINELIDARIPQVIETVANEVGDSIVPSIKEVHGGSASEVMDDDEEEG